MTEKNLSTDKTSISRFLKGDTRAFETLMNPYQQRLYTYLCRMIGDNEAARDVLQDVQLKVLKGLPQYREQMKFPNWLFSIAHNLALNYIRKNQRQTAVVDSEYWKSDTNFNDVSGDPSFSPEEILKNKELNIILKNAIEKLPVEQKQVLLLREYSDLPFKEIAEMLGSPLNTVLGRMRYALLNLRKIIQQDIGGNISDVL